MAETTDDRLRLLIERVERLEEEKKGISDDIKDVYLEAKAVGYDVKIMRQIVRLRKMNPDDRKEMDMLLDTYKAALGLGCGTGNEPACFYPGLTRVRFRHGDQLSARRLQARFVTGETGPGPSPGRRVNVRVSRRRPLRLPCHARLL
jgi:uncharacterized protein (UPF0335 family)